MKKWIFLIAGALLTACSTDESISELKLSVPAETVYTDGMDYSFDVVSSNGKYQVLVDADNTPTPTAKTTIVGNHVKVDLLSEYTALTITDQGNQPVHLLIISSNDAIKTQNYSVRVSYGSIMKTNAVRFGTGKFTVQSKYGNSAEVNIDNHDQFLIKSLRPGVSHFLIADQRGTTNGMTVTVGNGWDLSSKELTVSTVGNQYLTFPLKYGEGGWKIISPITNDPEICVMPKGELFEQDMLQVWVPKGNGKPIVFELKDKVNNTATITINVE